MNCYPDCVAEHKVAIPAQIRWILAWQLGITLIFAVLAGLGEGKHAFLSALLGGGIALVANFAYAWQSTRRKVQDGAKKVYRAQMWAEVLKFAVTVILFTLIFSKYRQVSGLPLFIAYLSTYAVFWLALLRKD